MAAVSAAILKDITISTVDGEEFVNEVARTRAAPDLFVMSSLEACENQQMFEFAGWRVMFHSNSRQLMTKLASYYQHFQGLGEPNFHLYGFVGDVPDFGLEWQDNTPEPGKRKVKENVGSWRGGRVVRKVLTGVHLFYAGELRLCAGPLLENPNQVVNFLNNMYLEVLLAGGGQLFHAAGVCSGRAGVGLAGRSGRGKSTLALRLLGQGLDLVSNDRLVVAEQGGTLTMHGVPKYPRINPGTIVNDPALTAMLDEANFARYRGLARDALWELEEKHDAFIESSFPGRRFLLAAEMAMFVGIDWDRKNGGAFKLEQISRDELGELCQSIMKSPGILLPKARERIPVARAEDYLALLDKTRLYRLSGGIDFDGAAEAIRAELASLSTRSP